MGEVNQGVGDGAPEIGDVELHFNNIDPGVASAEFGEPPGKLVVQTIFEEGPPRARGGDNYNRELLFRKKTAIESLTSEIAALERERIEREGNSRQGVRGAPGGIEAMAEAARQNGRDGMAKIDDALKQFVSRLATPPLPISALAGRLDPYLAVLVVGSDDEPMFSVLEHHEPAVQALYKMLGAVARAEQRRREADRIVSSDESATDDQADDRAGVAREPENGQM